MGDRHPDLAERVFRWRSDYAARPIGLDGLTPEVRERMVLDWVHQLEGFGSGLPMIEAMVRHHAERGHVLHSSTPEGVITGTIGAAE